MDLSFSPPDRVDAAELPAADLARLVALVAGLQADSATARALAALDDAPRAASAEPLAPADGAFNTGMAARLTAWQQT